MAIIMFLFGSGLGFLGASLQLSLGYGFGAAFLTYFIAAIGLPMVTLLAYAKQYQNS